MEKTASEPSTRNQQSPPSLKFIDMPIVLLGEDNTEYAQLRQQIEDYVRPLDIFEKMYVSDLAYYSWESLRYRKIIANLVDASKRYALERILRPLLPRKEITEETWVSPQFEPPPEAEVLSRAYCRNDPEAIGKVDRLMKEREVGWDAVGAEAVSLNLEQIDRLKRMILTADSFRSALLDELDRHRASPVRRFSAAMQQIENVPPQNRGRAA
jgi:hypothetical protein